MARQLRLDQQEWIEIVSSKGDVTGGFYWNPADLGIVKRCEKVMDYLNGIEAPSNSSSEETIEFISAAIKEQFDYLLSPGASKELFKWNEPFSPQSDGSFYVEYVMKCIKDFIESELDVRINKTTAKIEQYTAKYNK